MTCDDVQLHLGGYVLEGLTRDEAEAVADHLTCCPACRQDYEAIRGLPELLSLAVEAPPSPPAALRKKIMAEAAVVRSTARRTRRGRVLQLVAALVVGAVLGGGLVWSMRTPATDSAVRVALVSAGRFEAQGTLELYPSDNGVTVELRLRDLPPLAGDQVYEVWFAPPASSPLGVGTFRPNAAGTADLTLTAAGPIRRYDSVWITLEPDFSDPAHDGPTIVRAQLP